MDSIKHELEKVERYFNSQKKIEISLSSVQQQLELFLNGVKYPALIKPCTLDDGIIKIVEQDFDELIRDFNSASLNGRLFKFVPASGAATRMFHKIQSVINRYNTFDLKTLENNAVEDDECRYVIDFLLNLKRFSFYDDLKELLTAGDNEIENLISKNPASVLEAILFDNGLNYSSLPKGAIKFHNYEDTKRTAFEEQIFEALQYCADRHNVVKIHFTISEEHTDIFNQIVNSVKLKLANTEFKINASYSYQKKHTDTIAVNENNEIIFDENGNIILRPGGHGSLLENLNDLNSDIVVIKNIDNVCVERYNHDTIVYKKLLIGLLVKIQDSVFKYLNLLTDENQNLNSEDYQNIMRFAESTLSISKPGDFDIWNDYKKNKYLFEKLNRPLRVCGMVKNQGDPGGGPFWVNYGEDNLSLQIVEQAQINFNDDNQKKIFNQSTHFNPVDLVCGVKDFSGNNFNLLDFRDESTGIITRKSKDGDVIKALELPGLWNGGMAFWNTVFVEVPFSTFNPVKEVNDLLKKEHQNS